MSQFLRAEDTKICDMDCCEDRCKKGYRYCFNCQYKVRTQMRSEGFGHAHLNGLPKTYKDASGRPRYGQR